MSRDENSTHVFKLGGSINSYYNDISRSSTTYATMYQPNHEQRNTVPVHLTEPDNQLHGESTIQHATENKL